MQTSTVLEALCGGALIGVAASILLLGLGRICGIAGIAGSLLGPTDGRGWRVAFLAGLMAPGAIARFVEPDAIGGSPVSLTVVAAAGLLVGFGTRLGNGCTSGHGVCGISRFSVRSLVATITFMAIAAITVIVVRAAGGW
jgi:uncharacterized membrane protein YedE/YeeE